MFRRLSSLLIVGSLILSLFPAVVVAQAKKLTLPDIPNPQVLTYPHEVGRFGGLHVRAQITDPRTFNYGVARETSSTDILVPVFDGLVEQNYITGEIEPALAESWTVSPDGKTWVFTLRQGVQWHDGKPLTVDDVVFSYQYIFTEGVSSNFKDGLTFEGKPLQFRKLDGRRVHFRTEKPIAVFLRQIGVPILPKHKLGEALARGGLSSTGRGGSTHPSGRSWGPVHSCCRNMSQASA